MAGKRPGLTGGNRLEMKGKLGMYHLEEPGAPTSFRLANNRRTWQSGHRTRKPEKSGGNSYISTLVTTPCSLAAGSLLNCTKLGVNFLIKANIFQMGFFVSMSSMP